MRANDNFPVHRSLVEFTGSLEAGVLLGQLLYWTPRSTLEGGWIAKSDEEWKAECCLTIYGVQQAVKRLLTVGVEKKVRKFNNVPKNHYRINPDALLASHAAWSATRREASRVSPLQGAVSDETPDSAISQSRLGDSAKSKSPTLRNGTADSADSQSRLCESAESSITTPTATTTAKTTAAGGVGAVGNSPAPDGDALAKACKGSKIDPETVAVRDRAEIATWRNGIIVGFLPLAGAPVRYAPVTDDYVAELKDTFAPLDVTGALKRLKLVMRDDPSKRRPPGALGKFINTFLDIERTKAGDAGGRGRPSQRPAVPPSVNRLTVAPI